MNNKKLGKYGLFSILYGIFGSLGLFCIVSFVLMTAIDFRIERHPYAYPFYIIAGIISIGICICTFAGNVCYFLNDKNRPQKIITKEILLTVIIFVILFFLWNIGYNAVSDFLKYMRW